MRKHCISYPTKSLIFCKLSLSFRINQELLIVYNYKFICVSQLSILFHFTLMLLKLKHVLITADLVNQYLTKKVMLLYIKIVLIRCGKWISFQSAKYNHY